MGSVCCVADRDRAVTSTPNNESLHRNIRHYSPSWSFRCDNRVQVVGDESSSNSISISNGALGFNERVIKSRPASETAHASDEGSPLNNSQLPAIQKSLGPELRTGVARLPSTDSMIAGNSTEVKQLSSGWPEISFPSPVKFSPSVSSHSTSPLSLSQGHPSWTPTRWPRHSRRHHLLRQVSPTLSISEESSSDGWSIRTTFPDIITGSRRERWSFDSETLCFVHDKIYGSSRESISGCHRHFEELQSCGICARLLGISSNELAVVSVLICGHVYHGDCLENMTSEINKYDPACPVCNFGENQAFKMSEKGLTAEIELKNNKKRCRSKIAVGGVLSKGNHSSWKRGFFWAKSSTK